MPCCFLSILSSPATLNTANSDPIWIPSPLPVWAFQFHAAFPQLKLMLPMSVLRLHNCGILWILCSHQLQHVSYLQRSPVRRSCVSSAITKLFTSFAPPSECTHSNIPQKTPFCPHSLLCYSSVKFMRFFFQSINADFTATFMQQFTDSLLKHKHVHTQSLQCSFLEITK